VPQFANGIVMIMQVLLLRMPRQGRVPAFVARYSDSEQVAREALLSA
jgi:hypothetical protein